MSSTSKNYKWLPGAIYPPELEWLKWHIKKTNVDIIIECGRQDGASALWYFENFPTVEIYSIDLDDRVAVKKNSEKNLQKTSVKAITGNVFEEVPKIVRANIDKRICIIEDAVKSWPGLCLLASTMFYENVSIIAQHNLHTNHRTRQYWINSSRDPVFIEQSSDHEIKNSLKKWISEQDTSDFNRPYDESSLGVIDLTKNRVHAIDYMLRNRSLFKFWDPLSFRLNHSIPEHGFHKALLRRSLIRKLLNQKR